MKYADLDAFKVTPAIIARATKRYNKICWDHIVEEADTYNNPGWNLRDIVAEANYWLGTFYDSGHVHDTRDDWAWDDSGELRKEWYSATGKLRRFVAAYAPYISGMTCTETHGDGNYDNCTHMKR